MFARILTVALVATLALAGCGTSYPQEAPAALSIETHSEDMRALDAFAAVHTEILNGGVVAVRIYQNRFETLTKGTFGKWKLVDTVLLGDIAQVDYKSGFFSGNKVIVTLKNGNVYTWPTKSERIREVLLGLKK